jgi:hypothetical protein
MSANNLAPDLWASQITWRADYKVAYTVATREYWVWADSGIRGQIEDDVRLALQRTRPTCRVLRDLFWQLLQERFGNRVVVSGQFVLGEPLNRINGRH